MSGKKSNPVSSSTLSTVETYEPISVDEASAGTMNATIKKLPPESEKTTLKNASGNSMGEWPK